MSTSFLNEDQEDCLQELMNISYGSATASVAAIINKFAELSIPKISTISSENFKSYIESKIEDYTACYLVSQLIDGKLSGENLFIISEEALKNLALEFDLEEDELEETELKDVVLEITNIISSSTSGKLAELMNTDILFSPPDVKKIVTIDDLDNHYEIEYQYVIIISTMIHFEEQNISGKLIMMLKDDSMNFLKDSLDRIIDEY